MRIFSAKIITLYSIFIISIIVWGCKEKSTTESNIDELVSLEIKARQLIQTDSLRGEGLKLLQEGMMQYPSSWMLHVMAAACYVLEQDESNAEKYFSSAFHLCDSCLKVNPTASDSANHAFLLFLLNREDEGRTELLKQPQWREFADSFNRETCLELILQGLGINNYDDSE